MSYQQTNPFETLFTHLTSQQTAQRFLYTCYSRLPEVVDAELKSYENSEPFIYYIIHGREMLNQAKQSSLSVQPILFFYGMTHLLKACLLTRRPDYPETTTHLAHGVSARKRKKKHYTFLTDDLRIQQRGLFPYFSKHLYDADCTYYQKIGIDDLLTSVPELADILLLSGIDRLQYVGLLGQNKLILPLTILDAQQQTYDTFINRFRTKLSNASVITTDKLNIYITTEETLNQPNRPLLVCQQTERIFFPNKRTEVDQMSETMIHYLLLYNLSMISRYETSWWGDLLATKSDVDYPLICEFLRVATNKIPHLTGQFLMNEVSENNKRNK